MNGRHLEILIEHRQSRRVGQQLRGRSQERRWLRGGRRQCEWKSLSNADVRRGLAAWRGSAANGRRTLQRQARHFTRGRRHFERRERVECDSVSSANHHLLAIARRPRDADTRRECIDIVVAEPPVCVDEGHGASACDGAVGNVHAPAGFGWRSIDLPPYTVVQHQIPPDAPFILREEVVLLEPRTLIPKRHDISRKEGQILIGLEVSEKNL